MVQKLITKSEFARVAGVSATAVTKACHGALAPAVVKGRVDCAHSAAVAYVKKQEEPTRSDTGIDPMYQDAIATAHRAGKFNVPLLRRELKIGYTRAVRIIDMMRASGFVPDSAQATDPPPYIIHTTPARVKEAAEVLKGHAAAKEKKKRQAAEDPVDVPEDIQAFGHMTLYELVDKFGTDARFVDWLSATQKIEMINEKRLKNAQTKGQLISRELVAVGVIDVFNSAHLRLLKDGAKSIAAGVISKHSGGAELAEVEAYVSDILGSFLRPVKNKISRSLKNA